jgi:hypothetical protein
MMSLPGDARIQEPQRRIAKGSRPVISFRQLSHELSATNWKWTWIGLGALPAIHFYYVQEMIAALIMFSVLFVGAAIVVLIIFLLDRASQHVMTWAEAGVAWAVHRVVDAVEGNIASAVWAQAVPHRFRREQSKEK